MADVFDFYVYDDRSIRFAIAEPIMLEDKDVTEFRFRIPKSLNGFDMSTWAWWFVYVNAEGTKYSLPMTLTDDEDDLTNYALSTVTINYGMSGKAGIIKFAIEVIDADGSGNILHEWHTKTYSTNVESTLQGNQVQYSETESDVISALLQRVQQLILMGGGSPTVANTASAMSDTTKVYLYTGNESGYTFGDWYYYNGSAWTSGGEYGSGATTVDSVLSESSTNPVQNKVIYEALQDSGGLTDGAKQALLACFNNVAWIDTDGSDYYNALYNALYPPANLVSISCVYTQSGTVYDTDNLDSLKDDLVVTAHYDDSSTSVVTTYTLNGTLSVGTSTITVIYSGQTTTFNVTVTEKPRAWYTGVPLTLGTIESGTINTTTGADVEDGTKSRSGFLDIEGAFVFQSRNASTKAATGNNAKFFFYDADYDFISSKSFSSSTNAFTITTVPNDTKYVRVSASNEFLGDEATTPYEFVPYIRPVVSATAGDVAVTSDTVGYNISTTTGRQGTSGSTRSSQLIPIYGATAVSMTNSDSSSIGYASIALYDKDENYMGYVANYALSRWSNIPFRNCAYMRRYQFGTGGIPFTVSITV